MSTATSPLMGSDTGQDKDSGLPELGSTPLSLTKRLFILVPLIVLQAIGFGLAFAVYKTGPTEKYDKAMAALIAAEAQWTYAAAAMVAFTVRFVNVYPMMHKQQIMTARGPKTLGKNLRSNPFIYKAVGENAGPNAIIYDNDGEVGAYNRANRSLHHMVENMASVLFGLYLSGSAFPMPSFVCACIWCLGRVLHQIGYTSGYGGHGAGFALSAISQTAMEGMLLMVVYKACL